MIAALDMLAKAAALRADAFRELARTSTGGFALAPELAELLRKHAPRLAGSHGYRGHGIGRKYRGGRATAERAITVFVEKKLSKRELARRRAVPVSLTANGTTWPTDVVEFAVREKHSVRPGANIGPGNVSNPGTLTCFAYTSTQQFVGVTAGHVAAGATHLVSPDGSGVVFGAVDEQEESPIDAATILVISAHMRTLPDGSALQGWRSLTVDDVNTTRVSMFGARTGAWSAGTVEVLAAQMPDWQIECAFAYSADSAPGDSGGPIVDEDGCLVGLHLGRGTYHGRDVAIGNAIGRVFQEFQLTPSF